MTFADSFKTAFRSLTHNRVRTFLTMLGIIIGISSFILVNAVGAGAQALVLSLVNNFGSNLVSILPGASDEKGPPASVFGINITTLKQADAEAIARTVPNIEAVASYVRGAETVTYNGESHAATFYGVTPSYLNVQNTEIETGRFYTDDDEAAAAKVIVLGSKLREELFTDEDPIGKQVIMGSGRFEVIGVLKERGATAFVNLDDTFFMPLNTAQKVVLGIRYLNTIELKVNATENIDGVKEQVRSLLRARHRISNPENDDFDVRSTDQALSTLTSITGALKLFLTTIAAISLLVGGIGIMNIMYVAVSERSYEIGLRKAVGAKRQDILVQFLLEAVIVTIIAGVIGVIIGFLFAWLIAVAVSAFGFAWELIVSSFTVIIALSISSLIGLVFGIYPARRAAQKSPIEALVSEI